MSALCVSFDVWGTLLDLRRAYARIASRLAARLGVNAASLLERLRSAAREARRARLREGWSSWERGAEIVASRLGVGLDTLLDVVEEALLGDAAGLLLPGALDAVRLVRSLGARVGVLGNVLYWPSSVTRRVLGAAGLAEHLDAMLFADEIGYSKPAREAFEAIASRLGCSVESLTHVGDRIDEDAAGAVLAGGRGVLAWSRLVERPVCIHERLCATPDVKSVAILLESLG